MFNPPKTKNKCGPHTKLNLDFHVRIYELEKTLRLGPADGILVSTSWEVLNITVSKKAAIIKDKIRVL